MGVGTSRATQRALGGSATSSRVATFASPDMYGDYDTTTRFDAGPAGMVVESAAKYRCKGGGDACYDLKVRATMLPGGSLAGTV